MRAVVVTTMLLTAGARADVLLDKPLTTEGFGWNSNIGAQQMADDVVLPADGVANQLTWFGFNWDDATSANFRLRIFANGVGEPAAAAFYDESLGLVAGVDTGLDNQLTTSIRQYTSAIPPVALDSGTTYWLSIASSDAPEWTWSFAAGGLPGNTVFSRTTDAEAWQNLALAPEEYEPPVFEQSFRLEGTVPEPSGLVSAGLLASLCARRRGR